MIGERTRPAFLVSSQGCRRTDRGGTGSGQRDSVYRLSGQEEPETNTPEITSLIPTCRSSGWNGIPRVPPAVTAVTFHLLCKAKLSQVYNNESNRHVSGMGRRLFKSRLVSGTGF
ncbi:hypothetical protein JRQ81_009240 [Phrynocephalus forsythii]|uniref:Uncharacterized protein n=1 Tax=Phrynocephalus forsythii TaxID=171643 RepID=A0A9Q0X9I1_9SAUR|nr:hypothetical protein JRQ81_009240 [Phrynocephalus forsythii]